ncbi:DUF998 domain-containing protein [Naumannella huperziae]
MATAISTDRTRRGGRLRIVGLTALTITIQYFVIEAIVAGAWIDPAYSYVNNYISDLGAPRCATFADRAVCSPLHALMNASFLFQAVLVAVAVATLGPRLRSPGRWLVIILGSITAIGMAMVGIFPGSVVEDLGSDPLLHGTGAMLAILGGNLTVLCVGIVARRGPLLAAGSFVAAAVGLFAVLAQTVFGTDLGLGRGGVERLMVNPWLVWAIVVGVLGLVRRRRPHA